MSETIRLGIRSDLASIEVYDPFTGCRATDLVEQRLHVLAREDDEVSGFLTIAPHNFHGCPYVEFLCVHPERRRRGIASRLLGHLESLHAGRRLWISTESDQQPMLKLLEKLGYVRAGALSGINDEHGGADEVFFYKAG